MLILAVDTTSRVGSLALWHHDRLAEVLLGDGSRTHGERLPLEIAALLARAGVAADDIDLYAVVTGPGSFTGLRVGIAAVQGLALASGKRVVPVPALEAFARAPGLNDGTIAVWRDAQRRQVFAALFERQAGDVRARLPAVSMPPAEVVREWLARGIAPHLFIGDGVDAYAELVRGAWPGSASMTPAPALAPIAAAIAAGRPGQAVGPHALVPIYVRATDAELARAKRDAGDN